MLNMFLGGMVRKWLVVSVAWAALSASSMAQPAKERFFEVPQRGYTDTYDLDTVQVVVPGRFTIQRRALAYPDVMDFELKVLDGLKRYCDRAEGKYSPTPDMLAMGPPTAQVTDVQVSAGNGPKVIWWRYPYEAVAGMGFLRCTDKGYLESRDLILNGAQSKELFDCKRALWGSYLIEGAEPIVQPVAQGTWGAFTYEQVCFAVTHEKPYPPKPPSTK